MTPATAASEPIIIDRLDPEPLSPGAHRFWVNLAEDGAGRALRIPVMVARGASPGPVMGLTAVVHGDELNGLPIIHQLFRSIKADELCGTLVAVPLVNLPGFVRGQRKFNDDMDLNRIMPGKEPGSPSQVYAHRFVSRVLYCFQYLIDLHTASFGRVNSLYVRADMRYEVPATMARLISPQIIVHNEGADGTLRSAAGNLGIHAITVEVGDPNRFQRGMIRSSHLGIRAVLAHFRMLAEQAGHDAVDEDTVECNRSYWMYTDIGGVLQVFAKVAKRVKQGERIAVQTDLFGEVIREYHAPEDGIIVGASTNPVAQTGARIVHLGVEGTMPIEYPAPLTRC